MKKKDPNYVVRLEKAIAEKYGNEAIQNPRSTWTDEKEAEYIEQLKEFHTHSETHEETEEVKKGVFVPKKLLSNDSNRSCPVCNTYSFSPSDDIYMIKYDCCKNCYIRWVEDREERWLKGWRPNQ